MSNIVFNSFLNLLVSTDSKYTKDYIYDNRNFDVWFCNKSLNFSAENGMDKKLKDFPKLTSNISYLGNLNVFSIDTVFADDGLPSEFTYQSKDYLNIPASAYIFSKNQYPSTCKLNKDYNYQNFDYYVADTSLDINGKFALKNTNDYDITKLATYNNQIKSKWTPIADYFASEYCFSGEYDQAEYAVYDIPEERLVENKTNVYTNTSELLIPPTNVVGGALLITWFDGTRQNIYNNDGELTTTSGYTYKVDNDQGQEEERYKKYPLAYRNAPSTATSGNSIPVTYMELPKTYNLKDVKLNIQWSENGLFSLK